MQLSTRFIENLAVTKAKIAGYAVDETKIKLSNNAYLVARNAADTADINILKINASDEIEFATLPQSAVVPLNANDLVNKTYVDSVVQEQKPWSDEPITLVAGDITNGYVDLAEEIVAGSLFGMVDGAWGGFGTDFTLSLEGGVTRVTFAGDWLNLVATDTIYFKYQY